MIGRSGKVQSTFRRMEKPQASCIASRRTLRQIVDFVQLDYGKQPFFAKIIVRRKVFHRASEKAKKHPCEGAFFALAEAARFELADGCPSPHFECGSL